jgi:hypothetical protein
MSDLYNISFTTKKLVHKYDEKGKPIGAPTELANPITMTMLPRSTAMSYSGCDNFTIERYVSDNRGIRTSHRKGVGNGTKKVDWSAVDRDHKSSDKTSVAKPSAKTAVQKAAETGDMAAAVNV